MNHELKYFGTRADSYHTLVENKVLSYIGFWLDQFTNVTQNSSNLRDNNLFQKSIY
jgi:hypothetical protein